MSQLQQPNKGRMQLLGVQHTVEAHRPTHDFVIQLAAIVEVNGILLPVRHVNVCLRRTFEPSEDRHSRGEGLTLGSGRVR